MNTCTKEEIGPQERHGVSLSDICYEEKIKMNEIKKIVRTLPAGS